jgi:hypothetical protein
MNSNLSIQPVHILCTHCSAEKNKADGMLPASKRYISVRISRVEKMAMQSGLRFCILSGEFGLLDAGQPIPWYDHLLLPEEAPALVEKIVIQLQEKKISWVDYYARPVNVDPNNVPYTSTLKTACAKAGVAFNIHLFE